MRFLDGDNDDFRNYQALCRGESLRVRHFNYETGPWKWKRHELPLNFCLFVFVVTKVDQKESFSDWQEKVDLKNKKKRTLYYRDCTSFTYKTLPCFSYALLLLLWWYNNRIIISFYSESSAPIRSDFLVVNFLYCNYIVSHGFVVLPSQYLFLVKRTLGLPDTKRAFTPVVLLQWMPRIEKVSPFHSNRPSIDNVLILSFFSFLSF